MVLLVSDHAALDTTAAPPADLALPLLSLLVPSTLLSSPPAAPAGSAASRASLRSALSANQQGLVSPFDVYATLVELARLSTQPAAGRAAGRRRRAAPRGLGEAGPSLSSSSPSAEPSHVSAETWERFRAAFAANSATSSLPYGEVPRVGRAAARSLLHELPRDRDCEAAGIPRGVCRLAARRE